ncbi:SDR family NAD(P)-dependent oxidoreductase [Pedobacter soli]|uniref:NAD(P)-dependent dehydrogenase, short-chain alcohol dehydrogenase family n=1 Tax=Pedobacter soli TaxID=390242 RepID=A0A1G6JQN8_9SPHI|nr:SDR family oxidoreductase [Pedobacter soli]SDC20988.1 NAD(P)-dependent dehydrogenase, short-chain alcohol dehydrogenase family [Pedobacter soli]
MALTIDLKGKIALITGVTSGMGFEIAKMMAKAGCTVIGCATQSETSELAQRFLTEMESYDVHTDYFRADTCLTEDLEGLVADIRSGYGRLDILVSNAGKNRLTGSANSNAKEWQFNTHSNLTAHWRLAKKCKPLLAENIDVILIMASGYTYNSLIDRSGSAAEAPLTDLFKNLSNAWGPDISKVGIAPGFINIAGNQESLSGFQHAEAERQQMATPDETDSWCMFLASEYTAFASGVIHWVYGEENAVMQDD